MNEIRRDVFITRNTIKEPIAYVQATNTIPIKFTFRDWTIPTGAVAKVYVTKPSSKGTYDIARIEGNTVIVEPKDQTFAEVGTSTLQIQIVSGEKTLVSFSVPVNVEKNNVAGDVPESKNQSNFIDEYLTDIKGAIDKAEDITTDAEALVEDISKKLENGEFASSITIGTVKTGHAGEPASVSNSGTKNDVILEMTIPRGETGSVGKIETSTAENHLLYTVESAAILNELKGKTVQDPDPTQTDPKVIKGIGSRGWFDGELLQGYYHTGSGEYSASNNFICNKNKIICKKGDAVTLMYETKIDYLMLVFYDDKGKIIKSVASSRMVDSISYTILEDNVAYFNINIQYVATITPQTAKHITVLKNGKYCAWVRSVGKNLINPEQLVFGSVDGNGNLNSTNLRCRTGFIRVSGKPIYTTNLSTKYKVSSYQIYDKNMNFIGGSGIITEQTEYVICLYMKVDATVFSEVDLSELKDNSVITFHSVKPTKYIQYKESNIQIPLDEPLWNDGKICKADGKYGVYQKYKEVVLNGVEDWFLSNKGAHQAFGLGTISGIVPYSGGIFDRFVSNNDVPTGSVIGATTYSSGGNRIYITNGISSTIEEFKTWLQSNPVTVVYELENQQFIPFPDSAQAQFYNLRTYDQQTSVFLVDELSSEFTIDYASNSTGDYVLSGYSKAQTMESINADPFDIGLASDTKDGLMSKTEFTKLKGIESGAQKNPDLSGYYSTTNKPQKADVGLSLVDNTADANKSVMQSKVLGYGSGLTVETYGGNEINFGTQGANASDYIYFSYREFKGRPKIKTFIFGSNQDLAYIRFQHGQGNVDSADKLKTERKINGVSFDGTKNINTRTRIVVPKAKLTTSIYYDNGVVSAMLPVDIPKALGIATSTYSDWRTIVQVDAYHLMFGTPDQYNEQKVNLAYGEVVQIGTDLASGFSIAEKMDTSGILELTLKVGSSMDSSMANYKSQVGDLYVVVTMMDSYDIKTLT